MADYNAILDTQIEPDAPLTSALGGQFRDNPIAMAQGSDGAPVSFSHWHPYDAVAYGDSTDGIIYDFATDGAVSAVETPLFEPGFEYRIVGAGVRNTSSAASFRCALFQVTTSAYATPGIITGTINVTDFPGAQVTFDVYIPSPYLVRNFHEFEYRSHVFSGIGGSGSAASAMQIDAYATFNGVAQAVSKAMITPSGSLIGGGTIRLLRRLSKS